MTHASLMFQVALIRFEPVNYWNALLVKCEERGFSAARIIDCFLGPTSHLDLGRQEPMEGCYMSAQEDTEYGRVSFVAVKKTR